MERARVELRASGARLASAPLRELRHVCDRLDEPSLVAWAREPTPLACQSRERKLLMTSDDQREAEFPPGQPQQGDAAPEPDLEDQRGNRHGPPLRQLVEPEENAERVNGGHDDQLLAGRLKLVKNLDKRVLTQERARRNAVAMRAVRELVVMGTGESR